MTDVEECEHTNLQPVLDFKRMVAEAEEDGSGGVVAQAIMCTLQVVCGGCGQQFEWVGMEPGFAWDGPHRSLDHTSLIAPMVPPGMSVAAGLPTVDFGDPFAGKSDSQIDHIIRRAMQSPHHYSPELPNDSKVSHRVRAVRVALRAALAG